MHNNTKVPVQQVLAGLACRLRSTLKTPNAAFFSCAIAYPKAMTSQKLRLGRTRVVVHATSWSLSAKPLSERKSQVALILSGFSSRSLSPLLLVKLPCQLQLLARHNPLPLGESLFAALGNLVAFFGLRPETLHGKAIVQVDSEVEHDPDREHDIGCELEEEIASQSAPSE